MKLLRKDERSINYKVNKCPLRYMLSSWQTDCLTQEKLKIIKVEKIFSKRRSLARQLFHYV